MHYAAYVLVSVIDATTSLEARQKVMTDLTNDSSFVGESGRFFVPLCDWFVIGGGASGDLYPQQLRDEFFRQASQLNSQEKQPGCHNTKFPQNNQEQLDKLWQKLGEKYASPLTRDPDDDWGEEDDAQVLDKVLAERLNVFLQEIDEYIDADKYGIMRKAPWSIPVVISLDCDVLFGLTDFNDLVGKYWVVVIDCHA